MLRRDIAIAALLACALLADAATSRAASRTTASRNAQRDGGSCAPMGPEVLRQGTSAPPQFAACRTDTDCAIVVGVCCNPCSGLRQSEERAVQRTRAAAYRASLCRGRSAL